MRKPYARLLLGVLLALGAPLGWVGISMAAGWFWPMDPGLRIWLLVYMLLGSMVAFGAFGYLLGRDEERLASLSYQDHLTGLFNPRFFHAQLIKEFAGARRRGGPLTLVLMDLDYFKRVNDTYGHQAGDEVLKAVAGRISALLRAGDVVARVGGEEFAVILPGADLEGGRILAERIREAVRGAPVRTGDGLTIPIRLSLGVACAKGPVWETPTGLFARVDAALYRAKAEGRDRVVLAGEEETDKRLHP